jgi:hypothetical protein
MLTYFFHLDHGTTELDEDGTALSSISEVRDQAVALISGILRDGEGTAIWAGTPLRLWVTDKPLGAGQKLFTLSVSVVE